MGCGVNIGLVLGLVIMTTTNRTRALGSLAQILHLEYDDYDFDIVCSGWKCWVYRHGVENDISSKFIYLHKQARRNLLEEERQWKLR